MWQRTFSVGRGKTNKNRAGRILRSGSILLLALCLSACGQVPLQYTFDLPNPTIEDCSGQDCLAGDDFEVLYDSETMANRLLIGKDSGGNYKVRLTKSGYNAISDSDDTHYIFNSDRNMFKIAQTGTFSKTIGEGFNWGFHTVTHNLGYQPMVLFAWRRSDMSLEYNTPFFTSINKWAADEEDGSPDFPFLAITALLNIYHSSVDQTTFYVEQSEDAPEGGTTYYFRYYFCVETADS